MMDDSKKRFQIGFIGSLGFHLFVFLVLAFAGLFAANHVDDKIVEIAVFGGGCGGPLSRSDVLAGTGQRRFRSGFRRPALCPGGNPGR